VSSGVIYSVFPNFICNCREESIKLFRNCKPIISNQLTSLINLSIDTGVFPDSLEKAQVTPLHKKNDPLSKTNYRPVSVLPVFSKIFMVLSELF
jgi:hypothetical protein